MRTALVRFVAGALGFLSSGILFGLLDQAGKKAVITVTMVLVLTACAAIGRLR